METMFKIKFDKELTFYEIENFIATILLFSNKIDSGVSFVRMCDNSDQQVNCNLPPVSSTVCVYCGKPLPIVDAHMDCLITEKERLIKRDGR